MQYAFKEKEKDLNNWGKPERAPHWSVVEVYVGALRCVRSVNKKIR